MCKYKIKIIFSIEIALKNKKKRLYMIFLKMLNCKNVVSCVIFFYLNSFCKVIAIIEINIFNKKPADVTASNPLS
ncbi:MAG: hypothetical protein EAZ31_06325 [Cytophagia bacterium]|nr:MAG: hypothetical protein EAZ31_06325 [Cytophagia bacterium]